MRSFLLLAGASLMATASNAQQPAQPGNDAVSQMQTADGRAVAERAASLLEERYVDPATGARYAAALRAHAGRGEYAAYADRDALAKRMTADLQEVAADGHLRFYPVQVLDPTAPPATPPPAQTTGSTAVIVSREGEASITPGIRAMQWIKPGVAYVSFEHFDDGAQAMAAVRRFLSDYRSARALIIDSRGNHGGAFDMLGLMSNHLFDRSRLLANMDMATSVVTQFGAPFPIDGAVLKQVPGPTGMTRFQHWAVPARAAGRWSGMPVYYLTSRQTFSAAEHMAMVLKATHRATLVGEITGGGNHFGGTEPVGGGLEMYVPVGRTTDPKTGRDWEGTGIAPDVAVPAAGALDEALRLIAAR